MLVELLLSLLLVPQPVLDEMGFQTAQPMTASEGHHVRGDLHPPHTPVNTAAYRFGPCGSLGWVKK